MPNKLWATSETSVTNIKVCKPPCTVKHWTFHVEICRDDERTEEPTGISNWPRLTRRRWGLWTWRQWEGTSVFYSGLILAKESRTELLTNLKIFTPETKTKAGESREGTHGRWNINMATQQSLHLCDYRQNLTPTKLVPVTFLFSLPKMMVFLVSVAVPKPLHL